MFKDKTKSEINHKHFGVGSIMKAGNHQSYLVCGDGRVFGDVFLLDMNTFQVVTKTRIAVEDINFFTEKEVREISNSTPYIITEFEFDSKGLKK